MDAITKNLHGVLNIIPENKRHVTTQETVNSNPSVSFQDVLLSKHAALRLNDRSINLSNDQMNRVADAIVKAGEKGIKDSLGNPQMQIQLNRLPEQDLTIGNFIG